MAKPDTNRLSKRRSAKHHLSRRDDAHNRLDHLAAAIAEVRAGARISPRTSKLLASGAPKMAQKVIEEAAEAAIEAIRGEPPEDVIDYERFPAFGNAVMDIAD